MKKSLLTLCAVAFVATASAQSFTQRAEKTERMKSFTIAEAPAATASARLQAPQSRVAGSMDFGYCGDPYAPLSPGGAVGDELWQAIEVNGVNAQKFAGAQVTSINITAGSTAAEINAVTDVTVFLTYDLNGEPFYTQNATLSSIQFSNNVVTLTTPYTIEADKPFYFGYYFTHTASTIKAYPVVVDYQPTTQTEGGWVKYKYNGKYIWDNIAEYYGSLCITATLESDNLPEDYVSVSGLLMPASATVGSNFDFSFNVTNNGANKVNSVEYTVTAGDKVETFTKTLSAMSYNRTTTITGSFACDKIGVNVPVTVTLNKVNGNANKDANKTASGYINVLGAGAGFDKTVVIEEGTGTWCGWCPLGILAMETLKEKHADGTLEVICVHDDNDMGVESYVPLIRDYIDGFPSYVANRDRNYIGGFSQTVSTNNTALNNVYTKVRACKAVAHLEVVSAEYVDAARSQFNVEVNTTFALDANNGDTFRLSFAIVEDNVGPYDQLSYLSGSQYGDFNGNGKQYFSTIFNDVARDIVTYEGIEGSVPTTVVANQAINGTWRVTTPTTLQHAYGARVVALLINKATGAIENAASKTIRICGGVDDSELAGEAVAISAGAGEVLFDGNYTHADIYAIDGALVATANGDAAVALPAGLYIVKADDTVAKVLVR